MAALDWVAIFILDRDGFDFFGREFVGGGEKMDDGAVVPKLAVAIEEVVIDMVTIVLVAPI